MSPFRSSNPQSAASGAIAWFSLLLATGCVEIGTEHARLPLYVGGSEGRTTSAQTPEGWAIEVERAELAFGPLYLCAGYQAGSFCDVARLEWIDSAVIDVLDAKPRRVGELIGGTGVVRSWMYDLGIASLLTRDEPVVLQAARELGGSSVFVEVIARKAELTVGVAFEAQVAQSAGTEAGVPVVQHRTSERFEHEVTARDERLTIRFDPLSWLAEIDFDGLLAVEQCSRDAAARECLDERGRVRLSANSQGFRAIRSAILAGKRPSFEWR